MKDHYEVISPWAEADRVPAKGIADRIPDLENKKIGLLRNSKRASRLILDILEEKLKARFPSIEFSRLLFLPNNEVTATEDLPRFENWLKEIDALILSYGD